MIMRSSNKTSIFILKLLLVLTCVLNMATSWAQSVPAIPGISSSNTNGVVTINWSVPSGSVTRYLLVEDVDARIYEFPVGVNSFRPTITGSNIWYAIAACNGPSQSNCSRYSSYLSVNIPAASSSRSSSSVPSSISSSKSSSSSSSKSSSSSSSSVLAVPAQPATATLDADSVNSRFTITWSNVSAYKYELQYSGSSVDTSQVGSSWFTGTTVYSGTSTTVLKSAVTDFVIYQWRVRACNSANVCSAWTNTRKKTFPAIPVASTTSLISPVAGATEPLLPCFSWKVDPNALDVSVTVSTTTDFPEKRWHLNIGKDAEAACFSSSWLVKGLYPEEIGNPVLINGTTYYWRIVTTMPDGLAFTETRSFKASTTQPAPAQPATATLDADSVNSRFTINWSNVSAYKYELQYSGSSVDTSQVGTSWLAGPTIYSGTSTTVLKSAVTDFVIYQWRVRACNSSNVCSAWTNTRKKTFPAIPVASTTSLISPVAGATEPLLPCFSWKVDPNALDVSVTVSTTTDFPEKRWHLNIGKDAEAACFSSSWLSRGLYPEEIGNPVLVNGATYYWRIVTTMPDGLAFTETRSFKASSTAQAAPAAPASAALETDSVSSQFKITWGAVSAYKYELQYSGSSVDTSQVGSSWLAGPTVYSGTSTTVLKSAVTDFVIYQWRVRACNSSNVCSAWTNTRKKTFPAIPVASTTNLIAPTNNATEPLLPCFSWKVDPNALDVSVTVSTTTDFPEKRWHLNIGKDAEAACFSSSWLSRGLYPEEIGNPVLVNGATYYWRIVTTMPDGLAFTETRSFKASSTAQAAPAAPASAALETDSVSSQFKITWGAVSAYKYELQYSGSSVDTSQVGSSWLAGPTVYSGTSTTVLKSAVTDFVIYQWRVRACNSSNVCSAWTNTRKKTFPAIPVASTTNLIAPTNNATEPLLPCFSWKVDPNALDVSVTVSTTTDFPEKRWHLNIGKDAEAACFSSSWLSRGLYPEEIGNPVLVNGATYYWRVVTTMPDGLAFTETRSFIADASVIGNVGFTAVANTLARSYSLTWKPIKNIHSYELVYRDSDRLEDITTAEWLSYPETVAPEQFAKGALESSMFNYEHTYIQWKLRVCVSAVDCFESTTKVKTNQKSAGNTNVIALSPANNSNVDFAIENAPCFTWSGDASAQSYTLTVSDVPDFTERRWQKSGITETTTCWTNVNDWVRSGVYRTDLPENLEVGKTYYWRVVTFNADGSLGFSNTNAFSLISSAPTLAVTTDLVSGKFFVRWNDVDAQFYELQSRYTNSLDDINSASWGAVPLSNPETLSQAETLQKYQGFTYVQWQVRACQAANNCGAWQQSRIKTNQYGAVLSGVNLVAPANGFSVDVAVDQTVPCFKWSLDSNATDYVITVSDTTEFTERRWAKTVSGATEICWNNGDGWVPSGIYKDELPEALLRGFQYYWRVVSRYPNGSLGFSQTYSFGIADSSSPVIALLSPTPLESKRIFVGTKVPVMANVFDNFMRNWRNLDGRQPLVDYYVNNSALVNTRTGAGIPVEWFADKEGTFTVKAVAYLDDAKTLKTMEAEVRVVKPQIPSVAVQMSGAVGVGFTGEVNASVNDPDQQLEQITFFANGEPIGKASNVPPYRAMWTPSAAGNYTLTAKLIDKKGNEVTSAAKNILVQPTVFSTDGLNAPSDFGESPEGQEWRVTPLSVSDMLILQSANSSHISYNKLDKLIINRPLKIVNRSDVYDNQTVPQLIVLDADQVTLNSGIEIVGEPADLLIINSSASKLIRCNNCGFVNVQRAQLAVATPVMALSMPMNQVGELQTSTGGLLEINNLQASGVVSLELIADQVITKGHIDTQQYAHQSEEVNSKTGQLEPVLDFVPKADVNSVVVGSGGVSLVQGNLRVNYETMNLENVVPRAGVRAGVLDLQASISSGAINIFSTGAIQLNGNLSTQSYYRAAQIYRGQLRGQEEKVQLKSVLAATGAPSIRISGAVLSDALVQVIGYSAEIAATGGVQAHSIRTELIGQLKNEGYMRGYARATTENAANGDAMIELGVGSLDNRGEIRGVFNQLISASGNTSIEGKINVASEGDIYNRFGGEIKAKEIKMFAKGKIRNGSLFAFDATAPGGKESATVIDVASLDTERLGTHSTLSFSRSEPPLLNTKASIVGEDVTLQATQSVENINPYTEPYTSAAVEISTMSDNAEMHANDVQIEASKKLQIFSETYVLNSSAKLGVSQADAENMFFIKAPKIRNERYYSDIVIETFSDYEKVKAQSNVDVSDWAKGVQSRYGFYSPPGYIYSFAKAEFNFGANGNGLLNNISFVDLYGDLQVIGQGKVSTRGIALEKLAYESGTTTAVSIDECRAASYRGQAEAYRACSPRTTYVATPEGKLLKHSPDNTLFAVNGQAKASASVFNARNDQSLTVLRNRLVNTYEETMKQNAIDSHKDGRTGYIDRACDVESYTKTLENVIYVYQRFFTRTEGVKCYNQMAYAMTQSDQRGYLPNEYVQVFARKNITDLVNESIPGMGSDLNQQISNYNAWRAAAK